MKELGLEVPTSWESGFLVLGNIHQRKMLLINHNHICRFSHLYFVLHMLWSYLCWLLIFQCLWRPTSLQICFLLGTLCLLVGLDWFGQPFLLSLLESGLEYNILLDHKTHTTLENLPLHSVCSGDTQLLLNIFQFGTVT